MHTSLSFLLAGLFLCTACNETTTSTNAVAGETSIPGQLPTTGESFATVNGKKLTKATIDAILERIPEDQRASYLEKGIVAQMEEQLITTELIYQKAIESNIHTKPENEIPLILAQREVLVNGYLQQEIEARLTDEKLQAAYAERAVRYQNTEVELSAIWSDTEEKAKSVQALAQAPDADFAALAKEHTVREQEKETGGKMGTVPLSQMPPMLKTPLSAAKDGDVVGPIDLGGKFAIFKVHSKTSKVTPFEEVKQSLKEELARDESQKIVEELKASATIEHKSKTPQAPGTATVTTPAGGTTAPATKEAPKSTEPAKK